MSGLRPDEVFIDEAKHVEVAKVNKRLAMAAVLTVATNRPLASSQDLFRFQPPAAPPKLQKPNRKARRATKAKKRKAKR
jgi:hypothetical protein